MGLENPGVLIVFGAFVMIIVVTAIKVTGRTREKELAAHQDLRNREMEHERRLKELEIEKVKLELEKARVTQAADTAPR
ncbi:MAG: hypothetical protein KGM47_17895 [Acidobacteriota bacterium]|nr:hypothetical protein [Acidobacteriota bacterium]